MITKLCRINFFLIIQNNIFYGQSFYTSIALDKFLSFAIFIICIAQSTLVLDIKRPVIKLAQMLSQRLMMHYILIAKFVK